jgi:putative redox protein
MNSNGGTIFVDHVGDAQFSISIRGHEITVDQPRLGGGDDAGPMPTELFVASLASCVAFYGRSFLHRRELPDDVNVTASWWMELRPARVTRIILEVEAANVPAHRQEAFRRAIEHCTVHNTLGDLPEISFEIILGKETEAAVL